MNRLLSAVTAASPAKASDEIELTLWWWVIAIGAGAVALFWVIRRVAEYVVKRKTEAMVREHGGGDDPSET